MVRPDKGHQVLKDIICRHIIKAWLLTWACKCLLKDPICHRWAFKHTACHPMVPQLVPDKVPLDHPNVLAKKTYMLCNELLTLWRRRVCKKILATPNCSPYAPPLNINI